MHCQKATGSQTLLLKGPSILRAKASYASSPGTYPAALRPTRAAVLWAPPCWQTSPACPELAVKHCCVRQPFRPGGTHLTAAAQQPVPAQQEPHRFSHTSSGASRTRWPRTLTLPIENHRSVLTCESAGREQSKGPCVPPWRRKAATGMFADTLLWQLSIKDSSFSHLVTQSDSHTELLFLGHHGIRQLSRPRISEPVRLSAKRGGLQHRSAWLTFPWQAVSGKWSSVIPRSIFISSCFGQAGASRQAESPRAPHGPRSPRAAAARGEGCGPPPCCMQGLRLREDHRAWRTAIEFATHITVCSQPNKPCKKTKSRLPILGAFGSQPRHRFIRNSYI